MKLQSILFATACFLALPTTFWAKEVHLKKGEVYRDHDLVVTCEGENQGSAARPLIIKQCQYWDEYTQKCLFEKTTYTYNNLVCIEECKKWDSYRNACDYQNKCTFEGVYQSFVITDCANFDAYSRQCLETKDEILK